MTLCKRCNNQFESVRPHARVCAACQRKRARASTKDWETRNDRTAYFRAYGLRQREERLARLKAWVASQGPDFNRRWCRKWRRRNRYALKIKRKLGLASILDARRIIMQDVGA